MTPTYWHQQTPEKPLSQDLLWSRPENRASAGKLLIVGGNLHSFAAAAEAYQAAVEAGIGSVRVLLPDALKKTVGRILEVGEYAPSNPSGSFSQKALDEMLEQAAWADGVLVAGDLGRNSETAIVLEKFLAKYPGQVTLAKDAVDYITTNVSQIANRPKTTLVLSMAQLQRLFRAQKFAKAITFSLSLVQLVDILHEYSVLFNNHLVVEYNKTTLVASNGQVSTTGLNEMPEIWRAKTAAVAAVWWLQNPSKTFEALSTSLVSKT